MTAALLLTTAAWAQEMKVEFMTPSIVHVVKGEPTKSLVVIAKPEQVKVTQKGNTWKSSELTVKLEPETQTLVFMTSKGKVLLKEKGISMVRKNTGEFEVSQSFFLDKDETIYGLGTIQNGKMNRRGEHKRMEHRTWRTSRTCCRASRDGDSIGRTIRPRCLRITLRE